MTPHAPHAANFDLVARPYRWLEYLTLGRTLERCRLHLLPQLGDCRHALVLGDGDGRFLAHLLARNPTLTAEAVDTSARMLTLLRQRCAPYAARLTTHHADALTFTSTHACDLVVTHFFLDCLTQTELDQLVNRTRPHLRDGALWLISDFRIPPDGPLRLPAWLLVRALYAVFRLLAHLRTTRLPNHAAALTSAGLTRLTCRHSLAGLLTTELWHLPQRSVPTGPSRYRPSSTLAPMANLTQSSDHPLVAPSTPVVPDPLPNPEPATPSLPEPDPGVYHPDAQDA